ncbi:flagellar protein FliS [Nitrosomonas sp. PY1]|uniref:flagellar export chaperone FliS n=1 Tax=Nitrosomonas sp. PY1 TaxID=1803906 RepID=UPI001FC81CCD|nr:flagellar export chaperone FliS [Nitrosomonas sp. PY1]GKS68296.1 flagellar protein FliS [Nitrosomonas sp. PY1]
MYANNAISAYQRVGVETGVESADPHKLILMLFEGAQEALARAKKHMKHNEIAEKGQMLSKAIMIIDHGLKASLDMNVGGDLAIKLHALYEYMANQLLIANIQNNFETVDEVSKLLFELYDAWRQIGNTESMLIPAKTIAV